MVLVRGDVLWSRELLLSSVKINNVDNSGLIITDSPLIVLQINLLVGNNVYDASRVRFRAP